MTSSDNLASIGLPWMSHSPFPDSWISEAFNRDTETLTKALQKSLCDNSTTIATDSFSPLMDLIKPDPLQTPTGSGSDPDSSLSKRRSSVQVAGASGKVSKRKSRASKRSPTTFITADAANFRQMVQQVTGVRVGNRQVPVAQILKPEPQRLVNRFQGCLPTLDTSAFLLDHHHQVLVPPAPTQPTVSLPSPADNGGGGLEFDTFPVFPTLESWKVM